MTIGKFCFLLSFALSWPPAAVSGAPSDKPQYTIDAIRYGTIADFPVSGLVAGADRSRKIDSAYLRQDEH